ncbi:amidase domain-containing protein [Zongyangia hominis]|uniref:Amidase domain-containing protein n=1 Tax=Zongyangia hominis TaxID=2763677 RepID=A0A926ICF8_9FIRM|nr:amidase domain-containing protein [Zongyangia hominis]MBC8571080.1 amidase domain-containing protein [Zongyangia hominis]
MKQLREFPYDRAAAVRYAHQWAYDFNPRYYNFTNIGGDCTNYASQCLYAGCGVMNFTETFGWYYLDLNHRAPAWTGVIYLYNFLIRNEGPGPFATEVTIDRVEPGDLCQLVIDQPDYQHTPVIVKVGETPTPDSILVAAHTYNVDNHPLSSYDYKKLRFLHIEGYRKWSE